ncbi:MAG: diaminopimelate dehydrogenase [Clostridia bacterium]|nr:diaminopimelate dehydrogenase [Clostridia bacterium]
MQRTRVAVIGYGNVGRGAADAVAASPDFELAGIIRRRAASGETLHGQGWEAPAVERIADLGGAITGALVCAPTRELARSEKALLEAGISTVDSFDVHGDAMLAHREELIPWAQAGESVAVIAAGWDPGADSMVRALMEALAPSGITYTNFGPGMSMGHSVAVRAIRGVVDAISITLPAGWGKHRRAVYTVSDGSRPFQDIESEIRHDPYFVHDQTDVFQVESISGLFDTGHGVVIDRKGTSGAAANQILKWELHVCNPAFTGQTMLAALRAGLKQSPGVYAMPELPAAHLLPISIEETIRRLV